MNNAGGVAQFDVPMTYGGATVIQTSGALRISASTATMGIGAITLNGGVLQGDSLNSNFRGIAPLTISNTIELTADSTIQMQNNAGDFRLAGPVNLGSGSTGIVRQLTVGLDGTNAGLLYTAKGTAALLVPFANAMQQSHGTWDAVFLIAAGANILASLLAIAVLKPWRAGVIRKGQAEMGPVGAAA